MVQQQIKLCGKDVHLAYCYATEISFKVLSDEEVHDFINDAMVAVNAQKMPDVRKCIFLILSSITSYYDYKGEPAPIEDKDLMYNCEPDALGAALAVIIKMYMDFYHLSKEEAEKAKKGKKGPKGKN